MTTRPDLDTIQAALAILGETPWYTDDFEIHAGHPDEHTIDAPWIGETCNVALPDHGRARAEAIVAIHNSLPALIAYARNLEERLDQRTGDIADHALANAELRARITSLEAEREGWAESGRNETRIWAARVAELEQQHAAAPLADWTAELTTAGLEPYDGVITLDADDQPFARIHLAFHPDMDDTDRNKFLTTLGRVVLRAL